MMFHNTISKKTFNSQLLHNYNKLQHNNKLSYNYNTQMHYTNEQHDINNILPRISDRRRPVCGTSVGLRRL